MPMSLKIRSSSRSGLLRWAWRSRYACTRTSLATQALKSALLRWRRW